ncbi:MAG: tetratricopeptide repeat protein [Acidiferrobacter thiooxydans]|jgi:hypothetical protein
MMERPDLESEDSDPYRDAACRAEALWKIDPGCGLEVVRVLSKKGSVTAMIYLALAYRLGRGVPVDRQQAVAWYRKAEDKGSLDALYYLGGFYWEQGDRSQARNVLKRGQEQGGRKCAGLLRQLEAQENEEKGGPLVRAALATRKMEASRGFGELQALAKGGLTSAMLYLAEAYHLGKGTHPDRALAEHWYEQAYREGSRATKMQAARQLGWFHKQAGDYRKAYDAFVCGADLGDVLCFRALAAMSRDGLGCKKDPGQARLFLEQAAESGNVFIDRDLAYLMMSGRWGWRARARGLFLLLRTAARAGCLGCRNPRDVRLTR